MIMKSKSISEIPEEPVQADDLLSITISEKLVSLTEEEQDLIVRFYAWSEKYKWTRFEDEWKILRDDTFDYE